jgi:predicted membrane protein
MSLILCVFNVLLPCKLPFTVNININKYNVFLYIIFIFTKKIIYKLIDFFIYIFLIFAEIFHTFMKLILEIVSKFKF